ncbi:hypothetical protein A8950_2326 [Dongia mobilis]|uniref:N-acetyltransferase domain-containing protein n=1 Tax=Dongia mobilis TaxID=578943 RepID=A0A4R6WNJ2_9PROT|nr:hypothetical protein [Dongia mobilis]TDQ82503.1 hypothetical protein A8950_2326 [Dongia mobilis]
MSRPLRPLGSDDLLFVARHMRMADRAEIFATRFDDDPVALVAEILATDPMGAILAAADGAAVAAIGASEMWPGNWSVWMFATDRWPEVALAATRFAQTRLRPALHRLGARRAECRSMAGHEMAQSWLLRLGARVEAVYPAFGRDGQTFIGFVFEREENMCALPKSKPKPAPKQPDPRLAADAAAKAADDELRRQRALSGRRATILTPDAAQLGAAPIGGGQLLGS